MNKSARSAPTPTQVEDSILWCLLHTAHEIEEQLEADLAPLGLSLAKVGVLHLLVEAGEPVALSDLAARNSCVRSNITQLVDRLETDGLVRRVGDPDDRRVRRAELTTAGRTLSRQAALVIEAQQQRIAGALDREDAALVMAALERLAKR